MNNNKKAATPTFVLSPTLYFSFLEIGIWNDVVIIVFVGDLADDYNKIYYRRVSLETPFCA